MRLQAAGFAVTLIDPGDHRRAASFGNAGHIAAEQCEPMPSPATLKAAPGLLFGRGGPLDFRLTDAPMLASWAPRFLASARPERSEAIGNALRSLLREPLESWARLTELACAPSVVRPTGHNVVWMDATAARNGFAAWSRASTGTARFRPLEAEELAAYEGVIAKPPAGGVRFTGTGQVSEPKAAFDALIADFVRRGGRIHLGEVTTLQSGSADVRALFADGSAIEADLLLVAAGAWSGRLMATLGVHAPIIGERGYSMQSREHNWPANLPTTVFEERSLVLAPFDEGLRATSFVEFGNPDAPPDTRKWNRLGKHLSALGVRFSGAPDRWMGPRPTLPDYLPAIGRLQKNPRILYAFGHQHLGLTLTAVTAELVEAMAMGRAPSINLTPFRIERFA